jgi:carboxypeptidase PM20D1
MRREGVRLEYVLDEGGGIFNDFAGLDKPAAFIGIGEKGYVTFELSVEVSEAGHSSMPPPLTDTAIGILGDALHRLHEAPFPARLDGGVDQTLDYLGPEMPLINRVAVANRWLFAPLLIRQLGSTPFGNAALRTTVAPTIVEGGIKDNVLPSRAKMTINTRVLPKESVSTTRLHLKETINDDRVEIQPTALVKEPSRLSSTESAAFNQLHRTIREIYPTVVVAPFVVVAGTDATHFDDETLTENIYRFVPWRLGKDDLKRIHGANERLSRDDYVDLVRFYERLIRNTASTAN